MIPHLHPHAGDCEHACCLKIEHLSVHIGGETILDNIDLHMHCGQMVALIGPNGAGKSTLIRAILGQREYEGKITFHEASGKEAKLRIGYVPQSPAFDRGDPVSVMDLFTCCIFKRPAFLRPTKAMREKVLACLANVHGEALIDKRIGTLSGGELQRVLDCGVDKVIHVTGTGYDYFNNDAYTNLFTVLCRKYRPTAVMVGGTINGRDFAPRFAARLGTGCTSDATELVWDPKTTDIEFVEPAVGGKMMAVITVPVARPQVGTIRPGTFKCVPCGARAHEVIEEHIDFPVADIRTEILDFRADDLDESLNIADADVIVCVGNAIKGADALPRYRRLAERLGGKLACTRPVFDRGVLPFKLVIGQSGAVVKPKLLLSFGVSGAVNHVTGFSDADVVVAVNTDPEAAIFNYCTYGIVGDMDEVCEAMLAKLGA